MLIGLVQSANMEVIVSILEFLENADTHRRCPNHRSPDLEHKYQQRQQNQDQQHKIQLPHHSH